jgi:hypothetical protein
LFVNPAEDDFHLRHESAGVSGGSSEPAKLFADFKKLYGVELPANSSVMGAYDDIAQQPDRAPRWQPSRRRADGQSRSGLMP